MGLVRWFHQLGSPPYVYRLAGRVAPWFAVAACGLLVFGTYGGLVLAPPDYLQGEGFRIIYVHVPSAYLGMLAYMVMATSAPARHSAASAPLTVRVPAPAHLDSRLGLTSLLPSTPGLLVTPTPGAHASRAAHDAARAGVAWRGSHSMARCAAGRSGAPRERAR